MKEGPRGRVSASPAADEDERDIVAVLVKRTYALPPDGDRLEYADEQLDFVVEEAYEEKGYEPGHYPVSEFEMLPFKPATDIVVTGEVVAPGERPVDELQAGIQVGRHAKWLQVYGDRHIEMSEGGSIRFGAPQPFVRLPLNYTRAYGGVDPSVPRKEQPSNALELLEYLTLERHPGAYPRNPVGTGYAVNAHRWLVNGYALPNFEEPDDLLTPERIVIGSAEAWWRQPMPAGLGWFSRAWYPRCIHAGILPPFPPPDVEPAEVSRGLLADDHVAALKADPERNGYPRAAMLNGASPGLALPHLRGDEPVRVVGMDPRGERRFALPDDAPRIEVFFRGERLPVERQLHTVCIHKADDLVTLTWSGRARPGAILPTTLPTPAAPTIDPLEGFELRVDGYELEHETIDGGSVPFA